MQHEELNPRSNDPQFEQLVASLTRTRLDAVCSRRDELMFQCGQAAALADNRNASSCGWYSRSSWFSAAAMVLAFVAGGLAVRAVPEEGRFADPSPPEPSLRGDFFPPDSAPHVTGQLPRLATQRPAPPVSGERLFVAMRPADVERVFQRTASSPPTRSGSAPQEATETMRAASVHEILRGDSI